tara:strand:+ start:762 stop:1268 length:507 start_codon:yes stop_codon:yes gene_type:complete
MQKVQRYFLEIKIQDKKIFDFYTKHQSKISFVKTKDLEINKYFYKEIGADHFWRDRLIWTDKEWFKYIANKNLATWVMKNNDELVGFYENEFHPEKNEIELINLGILKRFRGKKFGSILLKHAIKTSFDLKPDRMWVHTCSLDHKFALNNYQTKGFKIFKKEEIDFVA